MSLSLEGNKISDAIVELLYDGLGNNKLLEDLNLSWNLIGNLGAKCLSDLINSTNL